MATWLSRIGRSSAAHPIRVIVSWVIVLVVVAGAASMLAKPLTDSYSVSGLRSISTLSTVDRDFGTSGSSGEIVFAAPAGQKLSASDAAVLKKLAAKVADVAGVSSAPDPFASGSTTVSPDQRVGYISVGLTQQNPSTATSDAIRSAVDAASSSDHRLEIAIGSDLVPVPDSGGSEGIALLIGFVVLLLTFGSLLAAGLPLVTAVLGLGISLEAIHLATAVVSLNSISTVLATLLGLAVGIDYSLFTVAR
jgi:RND superfamily putative drug exporter